jgi:uncharacterized protein
VRLFFAWLALLAALLGAPAAAQEFPARPAGPIYDGAGLIPDTDEAVLDQKLRAYDQRTGRALVVATVPDLGGDAVEDYAQRLYKAWGIGGAQSDAGVLLLVAKNDRKMRIEVGYGLEEYVTDILAGRIIRDDITPKFKAGDFSGGINAGVDDLITQLDRTPADAKAVAEAAATAETQHPRGQSGGAAIGGFVFWVFAILFFSSIFARRRAGRPFRGGGFGSTAGNILMWTALNAAMNSGRSSGSGWGGGGGGFGGGGGGGFGGFGGGMSGGGGASGSW